MIRENNKAAKTWNGENNLMKQKKTIDNET